MHCCACCLPLPGAALGVSVGTRVPGQGDEPPQALEMEQRERCHPSAAKAENCLIVRTGEGINEMRNTAAE